MNLTKRAIDAMIYRGASNARDVRWDAAIKGLGVRVYPTGDKAYVLSYRVNGRMRLMALGSCNVMALDQARQQAKKHLLAAKEGDDPLEAKQKAARGGNRQGPMQYLPRAIREGQEAVLARR